MILAKDKEGNLRLIGDQSISWYDDFEIIRRVKTSMELQRQKTNHVDEIHANQIMLLEKAEKEVEKRKRLLKEIESFM